MCFFSFLHFITGSVSEFESLNLSDSKISGLTVYPELETHEQSSRTQRTMTDHRSLEKCNEFYFRSETNSLLQVGFCSVKVPVALQVAASDPFIL